MYTVLHALTHSLVKIFSQATFFQGLLFSAGHMICSSTSTMSTSRFWDPFDTLLVQFTTEKRAKEWKMKSILS